MKAVIYARVSSKEQEETGYSLEAQLKLLREYASSKDVKIAKEFRVSESASKWQLRKTLDEMLSFCNKNGVDLILCEKIDRLTRSLKDAAIVDEWVGGKKERAVHFVKENFILSENTRAHENLVWDMKVAVARFYTNNLSEEVRKGQKEKLAQGWLPTKPPLGYKTIGEKGKKIHVVDEEKADYVREIFNLYATGQYSLKQLCKVMYDKGLRTRKGYAVAKSRMAALLSDPFYYGAIRWNDAVYGYGKQEPLISKPLFDSVEKVLRKGCTPKYRKHLYAFTGSIRCGDCGGKITWEKHKGIVYGHCNAYRNCAPRTWYKEQDLLKQVSATFEKLVVKSKRVAEWVVRTLKESNRNEEESRAVRVKDLQSQAERIGIKLAQLYDDRLDGRIPTEQYDIKARQLTEERKELEAEIGRQNNVGDETRELRVKIFELSQAASKIFQEADIDKQRTLIGLVFEELKMVDGKISYTFREPFRVLERAANETNSSKLPENAFSDSEILELNKSPYYSTSNDVEGIELKPKLACWSFFRTSNLLNVIQQPDYFAKETQELLASV